MKVKRLVTKKLKSIIFHYKIGSKIIKESKFYINKKTLLIYLTKREALSFIKWALKEGEWTRKQIKDVVEILVGITYENAKEDMRKHEKTKEKSK